MRVYILNQTTKAYDAHLPHELGLFIVIRPMRRIVYVHFSASIS